MKQELILKKRFVPHAELMELAGYIRDLKSIQIRSRFTYGDKVEIFGLMAQNHRCVLGALMVEIWGARDNCVDIENVLRETKIFDQMAFRTKLDVIERTSINIKFSFTDWRIMSLADKFVRMNDTGRTFNEIADWVEIEAYHRGEWK